MAAEVIRSAGTLRFAKRLAPNGLASASIAKLVQPICERKCRRESMANDLRLHDARCVPVIVPTPTRVQGARAVFKLLICRGLFHSPSGRVGLSRRGLGHRTPIYQPT